jgi:hypothetical protein
VLWRHTRRSPFAEFSQASRRLARLATDFLLGISRISKGYSTNTGTARGNISNRLPPYSSFCICSRSSNTHESFGVWDSCFTNTFGRRTRISRIWLLIHSHCRTRISRNWLLPSTNTPKKPTVSLKRLLAGRWHLVLVRLFGAAAFVNSEPKGRFEFRPVVTYPRRE